MMKIDLLTDIVKKCDEYLGDFNKYPINKRYDFLWGIAKTYKDEIPGLWIIVGIPSKTTCLSNDLQTAKDAVVNHISNIEREEKRMEHELELARLKNPSLSVTQTQHNSQNQNVSLNITLKQAVDIVNEIPDAVLSEMRKKF